MNWWVAGVGLVYSAAMVNSLMKTHWAWALVYFCYAVSAFALAYLEGK